MDDFKEVPDKVEAITPLWCQTALRKANVISPYTKVTDAEVKRLVNEDTGSADGGGMTSAQLVRINLKYEGATDSSYAPSPHTIVAKCMLDGKLMLGNMPIQWRILFYMMSGRNLEDDMWRRDIKFYREAIPFIKDVYSHPKVYHTGIIDGGNRGFFDELIRPVPHKVKTVTLMQDMQGWKSHVVGLNFLNFDQTVAILQNLAVLHGNFWRDKHKEVKEMFSQPAMSETEIRMAAGSKMAASGRRKSVRNTASILKMTTNMFKHWESHEFFRISDQYPIPSWIKSEQSTDSQENGIFVLKNENVLEMLKMYSERYPAFSAEYSEPFLQIPPQTLLHGEPHNGNHMYLEEEKGAVKVTAFDFQGVGPGMAVSDIIILLATSKRHTSYSEEIELLEKYHEALMLSGVEEYTMEDLKQHLVIGYLELLTKKLMDYSSMNPEKWLKALKGLFGAEKFADVQRIMGTGIECNTFLFLTSLYLMDKEKFLNGAQFIDVI